MISILVGTALLQAQVSMATPGQRLELFVEELAAKAGEPYHCSGYLKNEVIVAAFENQPIATIRDQLAKVVHGTWEKRPDGWWITQSSEQQKEERDWNSKQRFELIKMQIDGLAGLTPKAQWQVADAEKYSRDLIDSRRRTGEGIWTSAMRRALRFRSPEGRFAAMVGGSVIPDQITTSGLEYDFLHFADVPIPFHSKLPVNSDAAMKNYKHEMELLGQIGADLSLQTSSTKTAAHVTMAVESGELPYISFTFFDSDWVSTQSIFAGVYLLTSIRPEPELFPLSSRTKETMDLWQDLMIGDQGVKGLRQNPIADAAQKVFLNAVKKDPLSIIDGPLWMDYANYVHKPLIANLEEGVQTWRPKNKVPKMTGTRPMIGMERLDANGWVLARPVNPLQNRTWRIDRALIQSMAKTRTSQSSSEMSQLKAEYDDLYVAYFSKGIPAYEFMSEKPSESPLVGVLGCLSETQLNACKRGDTIAVTSLPNLVQVCLMDYILSGMLNVLSPIADRAVGGDLCPAIAFPNGLQGMRLGVRVRNDIEFQIQDSRFLSDSMADMRSSKQISDDQLFEVYRVKYLTSVIYLGNKEMTENSSIGSREFVGKYTWKTLPDEFKKHS